MMPGKRYSRNKWHLEELRMTISINKYFQISDRLNSSMIYVKKQL